MNMVTFTGRVVDPCQLYPEDVCIEDIAHSLSMQCRFAGHTKQFYSVAQHSVRVATSLENTAYREYVLQALLHDATEAYVQDLIRPIKHEPKLRGYLVIEERVWIAIAQKFKVPLTLHKEVELADRRALKAEILQFTKLPHDKFYDWFSLVEGLPFVDGAYPPNEAREDFMRMFNEYAV